MADATAVRVGYSGKVYVAAVGAAVPSDPFAAWGTGWADLGYISDDGLSETFGQTVTEFKVWGQPNAPVRTQVTSEESTFKLTFVEQSASVVSLFYGIGTADMASTAAVTGGSAHPQYTTFSKAAATAPDIRALGIDVVDGTNVTRIIVPRVQITDHGDLVYKSDTLIGYQVTFKGLLSSDGTSWQRIVTNLPLPA